MADTQKAIKELINKEVRRMMTGYKEMKAWMDRKYGTSKAKTTVTCDGKTYTGRIYGNDECYDGNEFYQFFLTDTALLKLYYHLPDGCDDLNNINYDAPYKVQAEDAQYWLEYVI